jgi:hypothetical protein
LDAPKGDYGTISETSELVVENFFSRFQPCDFFLPM